LSKLAHLVAQRHTGCGGGRRRLDVESAQLADLPAVFAGWAAGVYCGGFSGLAWSMAGTLVDWGCCCPPMPSAAWAPAT